MKLFRTLVLALILVFAASDTGAQPKPCTMTLEFYQSSFTLDIFEHIKNNMNTMEVTIPTTCEFAQRLKVGQSLSKQTNVGSLVIRGGIKSFNVDVKSVSK